MPKIQIFNLFNRKIYLVTVEGELYRKASLRQIWSQSKDTQYGNGLGNTKTDPNKVVRIGTLGEIAFGYLINKESDLSYIHGGDQQDFELLGCKIDVKVALKTSSRNFVLAKTERGKIIPVDKHVYVTGCLFDEQIDSAVIAFTGYHRQDVVQKLPPVPGYYNAGHFNRVLEVENAKTIDEFLKVIGISYNSI